MFFAAYESRKRERSPTSETFSSAPYNSPAVGLGMTSPTVDVLAKRQRMGNRSIGGVLEQISVQEQLPPLQCPLEPRVDSHDNGHDTNQGEGSRQYAEKRRARQWEQLNAPGPSSASPFMTPTSLPEPNNYVRSNSDASLLDQDLGYFASPTTHHRTGAAQPSRPQFKHHMSSSPIRHQPPGSSPFKSSGPSSQLTARDDWTSAEGSRRGTGDEILIDDNGEQDDGDEIMRPEDLRRNWGEHYARPNELLLSLHRSRQSQSRIPSTPRIMPMDNHPNHMLSSPFIRPGSTRSHSYRDIEAMGETHSSSDDIDSNAEVEREYEETNRLLGQLELDRRQRFNTD